MAQIGHENLNKRLINSKEGKVKFEKPTMSLDVLMHYGKSLVGEQDNVKRVQLADAYLAGAELAGTDGSSMPEQFAVRYAAAAAGVGQLQVAHLE